MSGRTVLVLPAWYPTARQPLSGPFVRDHARAAASRGHDVVVMVDDGPRRGLRGLFELSVTKDGDLTVVHFAARPRWARVVHLPALLLVAWRLGRAGRSVDVLHAHIHWMGWPAVIAGALLRRPVVISENSTEWPTRTISHGALLRARIAFRRAALVCPVNERLRAAIEGYGLRARFRIVPNTVDTGTFYPSSAPSTGVPTTLINVAIHVERKGIDILLRAFAIALETYPEITLVLIGEGPASPGLKELAAQLHIADRVDFRGAAAPPEIANSLRAADVLVLSSRSENLPLAVLEALCCGLPVVATDVGGNPEAVGTDGVLAPPGDTEGLAAAIDQVLREYARFERSEIAARAAARYSFTAVGRIWDEIYRSL